MYAEVLALATRNVDRFNEAEEMLEDAERIWLYSFGEYHPNEQSRTPITLQLPCQNGIAEESKDDERRSSVDFW